MAVPILVLSPSYTEDSITLAEAAWRQGWEVCRLARWHEWAPLVGREVAVYGELMFAAYLAEALGLVLLEPPVDWLCRLPWAYRKRDVLATTLGEARGMLGPAFFKPGDEKCFPAGVYASGREIPSAELLAPETPVLVAEPVTWRVEYRCFVRERRVEAMSPYLRFGQLARAEDGSWPAERAEAEAAAAFAESLLSDPAVDVPEAVVVDVGEIEGRGWAAVEANQAWASGIYGCEQEGVLRVVKAATVRGRLQ